MRQILSNDRGASLLEGAMLLVMLSVSTVVALEYLGASSTRPFTSAALAMRGVEGINFLGGLPIDSEGLLPTNPGEELNVP